MILEFALAPAGTGYAAVILIAAVMVLVSLQVSFAHLPKRLLDVNDTGASWASSTRTIDLSDRKRSLRRWHIIATICALVPPVLWGTRYLFVALGAPSCDDGLLYACLLDVAQLELAYLLLIVAIPVALHYLDRLHFADVPDAVVLAFGVWVIPRSMLAQAVDLDLPLVLATVLGIAGMVASLFLRAGRRRTMLRLASLLFILIPISPTLTLSYGVFLIGFPVAAMLIGYGIYRIEWKTMSCRVHSDGNHANNPNHAGQAHDGGLRRAKLKGRLTFVAGIVVAIAMSWLLNFMWDRIGTDTNQVVMALLTMLLAALTACVMYRVSRNFAVKQLAIDRALTAVVVTITASAVFHASSLPSVVDVAGSSESWFAGSWLPFVAAVAILGAIMVVITTLTRWMLQLRPLLVGMTWLVWAALPATEVNMWDPAQPAWTQLTLGAAIAGMALWLMWYGFGPGRASIGFNKR